MTTPTTATTAGVAVIKCSICNCNYTCSGIDHVSSKFHKENIKRQKGQQHPLTMEAYKKKFHIFTYGAIGGGVCAIAAAKEEQKGPKAQVYAEHIKDSHTTAIKQQTPGGIGGHCHQHGLPGGRYSAHGACSAVRKK